MAISIVPAEGAVEHHRVVALAIPHPNLPGETSPMFFIRRGELGGEWIDSQDAFGSYAQAERAHKLKNDQKD